MTLSGEARRGVALASYTRHSRRTKAGMGVAHPNHGSSPRTRTLAHNSNCLLCTLPARVGGGDGRAYWANGVGGDATFPASHARF